MAGLRPEKDLQRAHDNEQGRSFDSAKHTKLFAEEVDAIEGTLVSGRYDANPRELYISGTRLIDAAGNWLGVPMPGIPPLDPFSCRRLYVGVLPTSIGSEKAHIVGDAIVEGLISGVTDPVSAQDVATKAYVDGAVTSGVQTFNGRSGPVVAAYGDYPADFITIVPFGTISSIDVQAAIYELDADISNLGTIVGGIVAGVSLVFGREGVVVAAYGDYTASQVAFVPGGSISATDVRAAILELDSDIAALVTGVPSVFGRTGPIIAVDGDYTASQVDFVPVGSISAVTVQTALSEVDADVTSLSAVVAGLVTGVASVFGRVGPVVAVSGDYSAAQVSFTPASGIAATNAQAAIVEALTDANAYADALLGSLAPFVELRPAITGIPQSGNVEIDGQFEIGSGSDYLLASVDSLVIANSINMATMATGTFQTETIDGNKLANYSVNRILFNDNILNGKIAQYGNGGINLAFDSGDTVGTFEASRLAMTDMTSSLAVEVALSGTPFSAVGTTGNRFVVTIDGVTPSIVLDDATSPSTGYVSLTSDKIILTRSALSTQTITLDAVTGIISTLKSGGTSLLVEMLSGNSAKAGINVDSTRVVGPQGAAIANPTDPASTQAAVVSILNFLRNWGSILP